MQLAIGLQKLLYAYENFRIAYTSYESFSFVHRPATLERQPGSQGNLMRVRGLQVSEVFVSSVVTAITLGVSNAALAQEQDSNELTAITVAATRIETSVHDSPATVTVVSDQKIEELLVNDIKDLVRFEPGVSVRSSPVRFTAAGSSTGRDGNSGFNIRGMEGNRVLMLVDGVRVPDGYSFGAQAVGRGDYADLDLLKSVEIVRGPSSALYGSDGLAGSVSFTSKDPSDFLDAGGSWGGRVRAAYDSSNESFSQSIVGASRVGDFETMFAYTRRDGEGQDTRGTNDSASINRTTPNPEDNSSNAALLKAVYNLNESNRLRLTWDHLDRDIDWRVLSAVTASTASLTAFDETERDRLTLDHRYDGDGGLIDRIDTAVYYQDSNTRQFSSEDRTTLPDRIRDATFDNVVRGVNIELFSSFETGSVQHRLVYGGDYSITKQESLRTGTVPPAGETFPSHAFPTTDHTLAGVFVQDEITFADGRVSVYPALRWDYYEIDPKDDPLFVTSVPTAQDDSKVSPKLGLVVRVTEQLNLFVNAAAGYKAPEPSQVNTGFTNPVQGYRSISNADLKPETSETVEAGLRWSSDRLTASLVGFDGKYDDFIEQSVVGGSFTPADPAVFQFVNLSGAEIYGAEASVAVRLGAGFKVNAAASFARGDATNAGEEQPLETIDPFKLSTGLEWREASDRFGGQLFATYSDSKSPSRAGVECTPSCFLPDSFVVFDAVAWWQITDALTARAGVFNISDEKYWWWGDVRGVQSTATFIDAFSQPGRNASVSIAMQF
jgi:hemoglobin/transferrin/lactoferrin receptor protein